MNWLDKWNDVIKYIEDNLDTEIELEEISRIVYCPQIQFLKMFSYLTDMSLNEYIRKRKMTRASEELRSMNVKIIDIALKYGYDSPTAFNRAFKNIIGVAPSQVKHGNINLRAYPPISFKMIIKGECEMNYRIIEKNEFRIIGYKKRFNNDIDESMKKIPLFWDELIEQNKIFEMCKYMNDDIKGIVAVCSDDTKDFDYYIGVSTSKDKPIGLDEIVIPSSKWAVFECIGPIPYAIQNTQRRIMTEWLPNSNYKISSSPSLEVYYAGNQSSKNYKSEVWIPIK